MAEEATATENDGKTEAETNPPEKIEAEASSKTFTQDELDKVVQNRLAREREKFSDHDELKAKAAKLDEIEAANQSELEKAQVAREKAEKQSAEVLAKANERMLKAAVLSEAAAAQVKKPELLFRALDKNGLTVGDDGEVSGAKEAVEAFIADNPEFVGKQTPKEADQGARGNGADNQVSEAELANMTAEQIKKATDEGRLSGLL